MKKAIAGVLVVLGMLLPPGAAVAGLHESTWPGCFPLRSSGMFAQARCVTTRVTAGVGGSGLALCLGFQKSGGKKQTTPRSITMQTIFHGNPGKKEEIYDIHILDKNGPKKEKKQHTHTQPIITTDTGSI